MTRDHRLIDELLAIRALGALDGDDVAVLEREMADHGACDECARLEAAHAEVAGRLAFSLDPRPVPDAMVDRIVGEPRKAAAGAPEDEVSARRDARLGRWQAATGVAAAIALVLAIVLATRPTGAVFPRKVVPFEGGRGDLAMAYTPGEQGVLVLGTGLPDPGAGKVYELWIFEGDRPVRGACLRPAEGSVAAYLDTDLGATHLMAVTVEGRACPEAPTTDPVYTADLT